MPYRATFFHHHFYLCSAHLRLNSLYEKHLSMSSADFKIIKNTAQGNPQAVSHQILTPIRL